MPGYVQLYFECGRRGQVFFLFFFCNLLVIAFIIFFFTLTEYKTGTLQKVNKLLLKNTAKHKVLSKLFLMYAI